MFEVVKAFVGMYLPEREEEGQGLVEYALILVLISVVAIIALRAIGLEVLGVFENVETELSAG